MMMLHLLVAMLAAGPVTHGSINVPLRETAVVAPVTDKDLRPSRPPTCKNEAEVQIAVQQVRNGQAGDCWVKDASAFNRYR